MLPSRALWCQTPASAPVCARVRVCMVSACACANACKCIHVCMWVCVCVYIHISYARRHTHAHAQAHTLARRQICTHARIHTCKNAYKHTCMHLCMFYGVCLHKYIVQYTHDTHAYTTSTARVHTKKSLRASAWSICMRYLSTSTCACERGLASSCRSDCMH